MVRRVHRLLALALVGCGSDGSLEPAALAEVCGVTEPVRLLELAPDRVLLGPTRGFGDVLLYPVAHSISGYALVSYAWEPPTDIALWSSGPCGESPRRVADGVSDTYTHELWPDVLLGQHFWVGEGDDYVHLDLESGESSHVVFPYYGEWTAHGLLALVGDDADSHTLSLYPYPDDPRSETAAPVVLIDPALAPEYALSGFSRLQVTDDAAWVTTLDGVLLRVDLTGTLADAVTIEQTEVRSFDVSDDGRYLVWQDVKQTNEPPNTPEGLVFVRDRTTGEGMSLARTALAYIGNPLARAADGLLMLVLPNGVTRVHFLPTLEFVDLPHRLAILRGPLADGRYLLQRNGGPIFIGDLRDPEALTPLFGEGVRVAGEPGGMLVADLPADRDPEQHLDEGGLWFVPYDGSTPRRAADRISRYFRVLADGRVLTVLGIDDRGLGDLALIDPDTATTRLIDHHVPAQRPYWQIDGQLDGQIVRYPVVDGARSGVWMARLPPVE